VVPAAAAAAAAADFGENWEAHTKKHAAFLMSVITKALKGEAGH
jgi:hypothetical protein